MKEFTTLPNDKKVRCTFFSNIAILFYFSLVRDKIETQKTKRKAVLQKCFVLNNVHALNIKLFPLHFYKSCVKKKKGFEFLFKILCSFKSRKIIQTKILRT